jgi:hypothetical protein
MYWCQCYDFENIFAKNGFKKLANLSQNTAIFCRKNITFVFMKIANIFGEKRSKSPKKILQHGFSRKSPIFCRKVVKIAL